MLTPEEQKFMTYWSAQRRRKKKPLTGFTLGLPLGVLIVLALFINLVSGWHKRAAAIIQSNSSVILTILIAALCIVVFMIIFSRKYQWEQQEQRYRELLLKEESEKESAPLSSGQINN